MSESDARQEVAQASRILYGLGLVDAFGHVSRRSPSQPDRFFLSRNLAPGLVTPQDVIEHDLDGTAISNPQERLFLERFIHAEIYRARPDVSAVVHSHSPTVLPFTLVSEVRLQPVSHLCGFLAGVGAPFEISDVAGDATDLLIREPRLGRALAEHLADASVILMRGHGFTAVGAAMAEAVFRAVFTASNCEIQSSALSLGRPKYLTEGEAKACEKATTGQMDRAWRLWIDEYALEL